MAIDPNTLLNQARCFDCLTEDQRAIINLSLLCNIASQSVTPVTPPLFIERFENPPGGYDLAGWIEVGGGANIIDPNYTLVVLQGLQSLHVSDSSISNTFIHRSIAPIGSVFIFFKIQILNAAAGETYDVVVPRSAVGAQLAGAGVDLASMTFYVHVLGAGVSLAAPIALGVTYNCWFSYNKNNGANKIATFAFSTGTTRPTSGANFAQVTGAISATDVGDVAFGIVTSDFIDAEDIVMDYLIASTVQIGDNP